MKKHFVTFYSPGSFVHEETTKPIDSWNIEKAVKMSKEIKERYDAIPHSFQFKTRIRGDHDLDSKVSKVSKTYFLGGEILTLAEVKEKMPDERILISNMKGNGWDKIIINTNSWKATLPFTDDCELLKV